MSRQPSKERESEVESEAMFHMKLWSLSGLPAESGLESEKVNALFTNTKIAENHVQDILDIDPSGQTAKCLGCKA